MSNLNKKQTERLYWNANPNAHEFFKTLFYGCRCVTAAPWWRPTFLCGAGWHTCKPSANHSPAPRPADYLLLRRKGHKPTHTHCQLYLSPVGSSHQSLQDRLPTLVAPLNLTWLSKLCLRHLFPSGSCCQLTPDTVNECVSCGKWSLVTKVGLFKFKPHKEGSFRPIP